MGNKMNLQDELYELSENRIREEVKEIVKFLDYHGIKSIIFRKEERKDVFNDIFFEEKYYTEFLGLCVEIIIDPEDNDNNDHAKLWWK